MTTWRKIDSNSIQNKDKYIKDQKTYIKAINDDGKEAEFELKLYV